ncbi:hypothetical protein Tco_0782724 [Tanacetum coccineum]
MDSCWDRETEANEVKDSQYHRNKMYDVANKLNKGGLPEDQFNDQHWEQAAFSRTIRRQILTTADPVPQDNHECLTAEKTDSSQTRVGIFLLSFTLKNISIQTTGHAEDKNNIQKDEGSAVVRNKTRLVAKRLCQEGGGFVAQQELFVDPDHPEKSFLLPYQESFVWIKSSSKSLHFQTLIMSDALILAKALLEGYSFLGDKIAKVDVKK